MIVVKIELWPGGIEARAREIGRTYIANVGGTADRGNYLAAVCRRGSTACPLVGDGEGGAVVVGKPTRTGEVKDYPRLAYNVWRLVIRALRAAFPEEG